MIVSPVWLFVAMLVWHGLADRPLQPTWLSRAKRPGTNPRLHWLFALAIHGAVHGVGVGAIFVLGGYGWLWWVGVTEALTHAHIDGTKALKRITLVEDQALHIGWKVIWAAIAVVPNG